MISEKQQSTSPRGQEGKPGDQRERPNDVKDPERQRKPSKDRTAQPSETKKLGKRH